MTANNPEFNPSEEEIAAFTAGIKESNPTKIEGEKELDAKIAQEDKEIDTMLKGVVARGEVAKAADIKEVQPLNIDTSAIKAADAKKAKEVAEIDALLESIQKKGEQKPEDQEKAA